LLVTLCSSPLFFIVVSVHHHHHALFTIFPLPGARHLPTTVSLPGAPPPLPHFGKFALVRLRQVLFVHQRESIQAKKRQGANILKKTRKAKKRRKGKSAPYKATELYLGGRSFPLLGATPLPCFGIWCNILPYFRLSSFGKKNSGCCEPP